MPADIHTLPGIERRDLNGGPVPCEVVLREAIDAGVTSVIVVGRDRAGGLYLASSGSDADRDVGILMRAVTYLTTHEIDTHQPDPA